MEENKEAVRLPDSANLVLSSSPHLSAPVSDRRIMLLVILSLLPACAAGVWYFGLPALRVILYSLVFCVGAEALWCWIVGKPVGRTIGDCSAAVTGVLLALNLPPGVPFYVPLIGSFLAIWLGKQIYGGLGHNPFNPVLVGRVGLLIALPALMTTWNPATGMDEEFPSASLFGVDKAEVRTCATPLGAAKNLPAVVEDHTTAATKLAPEVETERRQGGRFAALDKPRMWWRYFIGQRGGCIGETCIPALLLGGLILFIFNLINYRVPLIFAGTVALITGVLHYFYPDLTPTPVFHLVTGGLFLGAIFMATDMVTSPITGWGCVWFALGCGVITSVIRIFGNYPEGVSFSILFMNALVPLLDKWCNLRPFGYVRRRKGATK